MATFDLPGLEIVANIYQEDGTWRIHHMNDDFHWEFLLQTNKFISQRNNIDYIFARSLGKALLRYIRMKNLKPVE